MRAYGRRLASSLWAAIGRTRNAVTHVIGADELALGLALGLVAAGFWRMPSWQAGAFLAPGVVLLWVFLPQRARFVEAPPPRSSRTK